MFNLRDLEAMKEVGIGGLTIFSLADTTRFDCLTTASLAWSLNAVNGPSVLRKSIVFGYLYPNIEGGQCWLKIVLVNEAANQIANVNRAVHAYSLTPTFASNNLIPRNASSGNVCS